MRNTYVTSYFLKLVIHNDNFLANCSPKCTGGNICSAPDACTCQTGYVRTPSESCVNLLIDFNNCGSIGYVCGSMYISCSNGVCGNAPGVQVENGMRATEWGSTMDADDLVATITVPFAISLYGSATTTPRVQSNGVCLVLFPIELLLERKYLPVYLAFYQISESF